MFWVIAHTPGPPLGAATLCDSETLPFLKAPILTSPRSCGRLLTGFLPQHPQKNERAAVDFAFPPPSSQ
jgi:hypothetical protein